MVRPSSGSKPVRAFEEILLIDGVQHFARRLLHDLVLQGGYGNRSLLPVFLGDVAPAQRLGTVLAPFQPLIELLDTLRGVPFVHLVCNAFPPCTGPLSSIPEYRVQRLSL